MELNIKSVRFANGLTICCFSVVLLLGANSVVSLIAFVGSTSEPAKTEPAPKIDDCDVQERYEKFKSAGTPGLIEYIAKCGNHITPFIIDARNSLERAETDLMRACIRANGCNATACLNSPNHLSADRLDALAAQAERQQGAETCKPRAPAPPVGSDPPSKPVILPTPLPPSGDTSASLQKLNLATKARVTLSIGKQNGFDADYGIAELLAQDLKANGFVVVNDASRAALRVEVVNVNAQADLTGKRFSGSYNAEWMGSASVTVRASWAEGHAELFPTQPFSGQGVGGREEDALKAARDNAREHIVDKFLTFVKR